ncbi:MAG: hypothetical protein OXE92_09130 [Bacteroidetes bacterium]|nr:hypothetical protein [Bacteroidota bacterium]
MKGSTDPISTGFRMLRSFHCRYFLTILLSGYLFFCYGPVISSAQELQTNMQIFENLGLACLESVPAEADTLMLSHSSTPPYVISTLINRWQQQGKHLFLSDSLRTQDAHFALSWEVTQSVISYTRINRNFLSRSATLSLHYTLLGKHGELIVQDICERSFSDEIPKNSVLDLESIAYPETQAELPPDRWIRRYLEPVIIAAATGLAAFLLFNLRNDSVDS